MRKSREEASQTRKRIVEAASREFRERGVVATGLNDLMKAAGLTHGGFYKHFESKDQLVAEAFAGAMEAMVSRLTAAGSSPAATYLSAEHKDHPADGCPLSAIGSELGRCDDRTRAAATDGFRRLVDVMAGLSRDASPADARRKALVAVSTMIGAITASRIVIDPELSAEILREAGKSFSKA